MQVKQYWQLVREKRSTLTGEDLMMVSVEDTTTGARGGVMVSMSADNAAVSLVKGTHVIATDEQIAAHEEQQNRIRQAILEQDAKRRGLDVLAGALNRTQELPKKGK